MNGYPYETIIPGAQPQDLVGNTQLGPYTQETTKRHAIGRRMLTHDGRVFRYSCASATLNTDLLAQQVTAQHMSYVNVAASTSIGATKIRLDFAATDGAAAGGVLAENELENGYLILFPHSENSMNRKIVSNTAVASGGGEVELTLDFGLNVATVVDVTHGEAICSPYYSIKASTTGDANKAFLGLPMVPATVGQYCWVQTWGPCWIAPQTNVGAAAYSTQVVARYDGTIQVHDNTATSLAGDLAQHIGYVISRGAAAAQGAPFIMMQISI